MGTPETVKRRILPDPPPGGQPVGAGMRTFVLEIAEQPLGCFAVKGLRQYRR